MGLALIPAVSSLRASPRVMHFQFCIYVNLHGPVFVGHTCAQNLTKKLMAHRIMIMSASCAGHHQLISDSSRRHNDSMRGTTSAGGGRKSSRARSARRGDRTRAWREGRSRARESDVDRRDAWMQSSEEVGIYAKPQPLFANFTKLQTSIAKPLEGYFLVFSANMSMQSLFVKPL